MNLSWFMYHKKEHIFQCLPCANHRHMWQGHISVQIGQVPVFMDITSVSYVRNKNIYWACTLCKVLVRRCGGSLELGNLWCSWDERKLRMGTLVTHGNTGHCTHAGGISKGLKVWHERQGLWLKVKRENWEYVFQQLEFGLNIQVEFSLREIRPGTCIR